LAPRVHPLNFLDHAQPPQHPGYEEKLRAYTLREIGDRDRSLAAGDRKMAVRSSVLAFVLCSLAPVPQPTSREFPASKFDQTRPAVTIASDWFVYHHALGRAVPASGTVVGHLFGPRFLFRSERRLSRYGSVLLSGVRPGDDRGIGRGAPALPLDQ
jgi:hypothetical protein